MTDDPKMTTQPIEPVIVKMLGTGDGGSKPIPSGTTATTPDHLPNLISVSISWTTVILVRSLKAFVTSITTMLPVAGATGIIPAQDFMDLLWKCASLSLGVGIGAALVAVGELLTKLDQKYPGFTA